MNEVKLWIPELTGEARPVHFVEEEESLNRRLESGPAWCDQRFKGPLTVDAEAFRRREQLVLAGTLSGRLTASCPLCLEEFDADLERAFRFVLVEGESGAEDDDAGLTHYEGDALDLGPLLVEQALLEIDAAQPCREDCLGLCPGCGVNRNNESCRCSPQRE